MARGLQDRRGDPRVGGREQLDQQLERLGHHNAVLREQVERLQRAARPVPRFPSGLDMAGGWA
jgi:hypothetical protein